MAKFEGSGLGWTFNVELEDSTGAPAASGLAVRKIRHDGHNMAEDIRLIGMWLTLEHIPFDGSSNRTEMKFVEVTQASFQVSAVRTVSPTGPKSGTRSGISGTFDYLKNGLAGLSFADYFDDGTNYSAYGIVCNFNGPELFKKLGFDNCEQAGISIEQTFLFSRYANDPPHEPSGGLTAARCHPMVSFKLFPNPNFEAVRNYTRIISLRFDYRAQFYVDTNLRDRSEQSGLWDAQQAGLFADTDIGTARTFLRGVKIVLPGGGSLSKHISKQAFYAVEKPLVQEVVAPGLIDGRPAGDLPDHTDVVCWDNIHWWGARSPGRYMISTPGAFHAVHLHWRWGEFLRSLVGRAGASAWRRFAPGDALIDPRIRKQDLMIAIARYNVRKDPVRVPLNNLSTEVWSDLFHKKNTPVPEVVEQGSDLVLWYSARVNQDLKQTWSEGAVFIHGIFFAHNAEPYGLSISVGSRLPLYWDRDSDDIKISKAWFRPANT